jgi:pimeloyl-ACP methyl ester carboxylesterase
MSPSPSGCVPSRLVNAPDPNQFAVKHAEVRNGVTIAYVREGEGGTPLLLLHGYPETKRIWWRNIAPLAAAGFDVIAPDFRGHGDSSLAPDNFYDIAAYSIDCYTLVHDVLGLEHCALAGGDVGGVVLYDIGLRYPGFVTKQIAFNTVPPPLQQVYDDAGLPPDDVRERRAQSDYFVRQANDPDGLLAELDTPAQRTRYVGGMYSHRLWGTPNAFTLEDIAFHAGPYADADKLRASWGVYEQSAGKRAMEDIPRLFEPTPIPTMVLYGPDDHVVLPSFPYKQAAACLDCTGPLVIPNAGHFLQWEQAETFNRLCALFLR